MVCLWLATGSFLVPGSAIPAQAGYEEGVAAYSRGDWRTAFAEWEPLARTGNASAQNNLGLLYKYGRGVERDLKRAVEWYRRAAEQDHAVAQFNLGLMYDNGLGVTQDFEAAARWFRLAADKDVARAQTFLGMMYWAGKGVSKDRSLALFWTTIAADRGDELAQRNKKIFVREMTEIEIDRSEEMIGQSR